MSDEHKPHDDHDKDAGPGHTADSGHDAGHGIPEPAAAPAASPEDHAPHAAPTESGHDDASPTGPLSPVSESHAAEAHEDLSPVVAHDEIGHAAAPEAPEAPEAPVSPVSETDHGHEAPVHSAPDHETLTHDDHAAEPADTAPAVAAVAAAGAAGATKRPVWSDSGDAPFEDIDATPVYARGSGGKKRKSGGGSSNEGLEIFKTIFFALLIALVLRVFLFQPFTIPSASMEPNLYEGDYIVVSKWSYGYSKHSIPFSPPLFNGRIFGQEPKRGDIVVFKLPRDNQTDYIKRLIGLPGDRIQMINNTLFINGTAVRDVEMSRQDVQNLYGSQLTIQMRETLPEGREINVQDWGPGNISDDTPVFEVPAGHYFMIGDNRDNSQDSRYDQSVGVGYVPAENLIGKAEIILFSWKPGASLWNPVSWFSKVQLDRFFTVLD